MSEAQSAGFATNITLVYYRLNLTG